VNEQPVCPSIQSVLAPFEKVYGQVRADYDIFSTVYPDNITLTDNNEVTIS